MRAPSFVPGASVLHADDLGHITEARSYLDELRKLAVEARGVMAVDREKALEAGYKEGFGHGMREALAQLGPAVIEARGLLKASQADLATIVLAAVERIIGRLDPREAALAALAQALAEMAGSVEVELRVAPDDLATLEPDVARLRQEGRADGLGPMTADPVLQPGEMVLVTPKGRVHVGLRQQLGRLRAGLEQAGAVGK
jgi:flagellar biosynthesis/type III secretory pathway protein FliH